MFLDSDKFISALRLKKKTAYMNNEKEKIRAKISQDSIKLIELQSDKKKLEKFAREEYLMKKDDEEIYIIVRK